MIKTDIMESYPAEIVWRGFNFPWCTGFSTSHYRKGLDLFIHREPNEFQPQHLLPILLFNIEANLKNNHLERKVIQIAELTGTIAPEQYRIRKAKAADTQDLNTRLLYDLTRLKRVSATSFLNNFPIII